SAVCASNGLDVVGAEGKSVTFHLQNVKGEDLAWSFGTETIVTIELGTPIRPKFYDKSYKSRMTFSDNGRALTISQLRKNDAGIYTAKAEEFRAYFTLRVYSEVSEPTVSCVRWNCSDAGCRYTLRCAVETPGDKSFFWSHNGQGVDEGPELEVEVLHLEHPDPPLYTCMVQNPVSSSNITVSPAETC
ncbi:SLAF7 protein, partial [Penelope pileata]|nr:SLAF7 protein [Penelope pileata]